jgi:hypothetical protein
LGSGGCDGDGSEFLPSFGPALTHSPLVLRRACLGDRVRRLEHADQDQRTLVGEVQFPSQSWENA